MTLTEQATQDAQAVANAQILLNAVTTQASISASALAALAPAIPLIDAIGVEASNLGPSISAPIIGLIMQLKALLNV